MKKKLLSLAIAGVSVVAANSYAAGPTVYGKLNVSLQQIDQEKRSGTEAVTDVDNWQLLSNSSRLGVMGDFDINSSLKAVYKLEYEVYVDDGDDGSTVTDTNGEDDDVKSSVNSEFSQRNIYVGLQGKDWGTIIAGKFDSPLKAAQGTVDQFNDMYLSDIKYLMVGEDRPSNIIQYTTPSMGGLIVTAAIMPGEQTDDENASAQGEDDGVADYTSLAVEYKTGGLRLAAAYDGDLVNNDVLRLVGEFTMDQFQVGALYQMAESSDSDTAAAIYNPYSVTSLTGDSEQDSWIISGAFKANDKLKFKAQVGMGETKMEDDINDFGKLETQEIAAGVDYSLAASTTLFGYVSQISWDYKDLDVDGDGNTFGVGIDHKF